MDWADGMTFGDWLGIALMLVGIFALIALVGFLNALKSRLAGTMDALTSTLTSSQRTMRQVEALIAQLKDSQLIESVKDTLLSAETAVGKVDPLLRQLESTVVEARSLIDDVTQTSQSARARIDDLAAMQRELHDISSSLAEITAGLQENDISGKMANLVGDASVLAADLGTLIESATSIVQGGKPLVQSIGTVVNKAKRGVQSVSAAIDGVKEGIHAGVEVMQGGDGQRDEV
jgi:methyl-accepting chemotaxis protein